MQEAAAGSRTGGFLGGLPGQLPYNPRLRDEEEEEDEESEYEWYYEDEEDASR